MVWFIPLISAVGGFIVRKRVWVAGVGFVYYFYDEAGELVGEFIGDEVQQGIEDGMEAGFEFVDEEILDPLTDTLSGLGSDIGSGLLGLVRGAGVAVIESVEDLYQYLGGKIGGKKVQLTSAVTSLVIIGFTVAYIFARIPSGGDSE